MDAAPDADRLPQRRRTHGPVGKDIVKCCLNVRMNSDEFHILRTNDALYASKRETYFLVGRARLKSSRSSVFSRFQVATTCASDAPR